MLCYRDMTFCTFDVLCVNATECPRPLTAQIRAEAERFGLGVCLFLERPDCFTQREEKTYAESPADIPPES